MVHKRTSHTYRSHSAGDPSPKLTVDDAVKLIQSDDLLTGYDKALLLGLITEMRDYTQVFKELRGTPKVTIFGSARTKPDHPDYQITHDFAAKITQDFGYDVVTGAGPGIMEAGNRGAGLDHAIGLNISLPFEQEANPYLRDDRLITFYYFMIRKLGFVREVDAIVLCPGGLGTMDEAFEVLTLIQTGRHTPVPIVLLEHDGGTFWQPFIDMIQHMVNQNTVSPEDLELFVHTTNIDDAIAYINRFYYAYHSLRFLDGDLASIRLNRDVPDNLLDDLYRKYPALFKSEITRHDGAIPGKTVEPDLIHLQRLVFKIDFTRPMDLYRFIRDLNSHATVATTAEEAHCNPRPRRIKVDAHEQ